MMRDAEAFSPQLVHAAGNDLQRVDVQAGVGLVQEGEGRLQHEHLEDFHAFLLPAGKALVQVAVDEGLVDLHEIHGLAEALDERGDVHPLAVRPELRRAA